MQIILRQAGKKFNQEWIFRNLDYTFHSGKAYAILGANGSGKSTLLQVINGSMQATAGEITYTKENQNIPVDKVYRYISLGLPYQDLIWEFSLRESIAFQRRFKDFLPGLKDEDIIGLCQLGKHKNKPLRYFSSGMKQRVRQALAILSNTDVVLLDEPCMNLDAAGRAWFDELLNQYRNNRLVIISSNHMEDEIRHCQEHIDIHQYKT
ncbi:MAG TPA: ATP-binding cassette domain-containing protein [Bacteroidales bacterium]|nr:ATP-binding cassette domain-containing protein [Bacteroidales bacterium]